MVTQEVSRLLQQSDYVVVDIETTGLNPLKAAKIIEIGAVKISNGQLIEQFHTLINPEVKISTKITKITGIDFELVKDSPKYEEVLPYFYQFIEGCVIICHNAIFDWDNFLTYFLKRIGLTARNSVLDTVKLFKDQFPGESAKLNLMCEKLGIPFVGHHRALNDATVTALSFLKLKDMCLAAIPTEWINSDIALEWPKAEVYPKVSTLVVSVNYWEKMTSKKQTHRRIYVALRDGQTYGQVYLNLNNKQWYNNSFPESLNFDEVANRTMSYLFLTNVQDLWNYTG